MLIIRDMCIRSVFQRIRREMSQAEMNGESVLEVHLNSAHAYHCLDTWCRGWVRRAGPVGRWKDSKGNLVSFVKR